MAWLGIFVQKIQLKNFCEYKFLVILMVILKVIYGNLPQTTKELFLKFLEIFGNL